jgi:hypothetical protein
MNNDYPHFDLKSYLKGLVSLSGILLAIILFFFLGMALGVSQLHDPVVAVQSANSSPLPSPKVYSQDTLWQLIQQFRVDNELQPYKEETQLCSFADRRLQEIQTSFTHTLFKTEALAYPFQTFSENLSRNFDNEAETLQGWLYSSTHAENLRKPYIYSCLRCQNSYCVQEFANK